MTGCRHVQHELKPIYCQDQCVVVDSNMKLHFFSIQNFLIIFVLENRYCLQDNYTTVYPTVIARTTSSEFQLSEDVEYAVCCNYQLIFSCKDLRQSLLACYSTYYVLDLHYPAVLKTFFCFLDAFVFEVSGKVKVPASCQKVVNRLMA
jgi:hypothetical protein